VALAALDRLNQTAELKRRWIAISSRLALACSYSPSPDDVDTLRKAADYARDLDDIDALCRIQYWLGWIVYALGDQVQSIEHLEAALAHARLLQKPKLEAQFLATLGQSQAAACFYEDAFPSLDQAIEMKRQQSKPHDMRARMGTAYTMAAKAFALGDLGRFPEANELIESAIDSIEGVVDAIQGSIRALQAVILIWQGRWEDCIAVTEIAEATATRVNGAYVFGMSRAENAYARYMLDGTPESLGTLRRSSDWLVERGMCLYISLNYGWLADAMARAGETRLARHYAHGAQARAQIHDHVGEGMACRALARLSARGEPDLRSPDHYLERAMACGVERDSARERVMTQLRLGELKRGRGEHAEGIALLENAREAMMRMEMDWHAAEATRLIERA
jgi:tetratricopeptide (TPR) repeat protein